MSDIDMVVRAFVANLDEPPYPTSRSELSPMLCVLTVLLSLDERKPGYVSERITRLQSPDPGYNTLSGIRAVVGNPDNGFLTPEQYFRMDARDDGKRAGLLLPLLDRLVDELRDFPGDTEAEQARAWAIAARPSDWTFGPYRGLGLRGFQHLRQLLGANTVVPTEEVVAFVAKAVGRELDAPEAVHLLERAAGRLRYDLGGIPEDRSLFERALQTKTEEMSVPKAPTKPFSPEWRKRLIRYSVDLYFKPDTVDQLAEVVDRASSVEDEQVQKILAESSAEQREMAEDWAEIRGGELSEIGSLTGELMINAIHRLVEITTKHMVVLAFPGFDPKSASYIKDLKKGLLKRGFDLEATSCYLAFDEVRLISNAIKHNGEVDEKLAGCPGWKVGQPLGDLRPHYERLLPSIKDYVSDLSQRFIAAVV